MIKTYIKTAWRNILKNKSATIINITGLSLGMAAAILIMLWVQNEMNFDNYHPNAGNIYYIEMGESASGAKYGGTPYPLATTLKKEIAGISETTQFMPGYGFNSPVLNINEKFFREKSLVYVGRNWFDFFHYDFISGNAAAFNGNPNSIILTASLAKKYYGNEPAVGKMIHIDSSDYRVQAVVEDKPFQFQFSVRYFFAGSGLSKISQAGISTME